MTEKLRTSRGIQICAMRLSALPLAMTINAWVSSHPLKLPMSSTVIQSNKVTLFLQEASGLSSLLPELEKRNVPLYGILHEEKGAEEFNKYLQGDLLLDEKVCLLADYSAATK